MDGSRRAHLGIQGGDGCRSVGKAYFAHPFAFRSEFLVQCMEEFGNGEVKSSLGGHDGGAAN